MATRVLYVNHVGAVSGAEQSLLTLLAQLDLSRVEPHLACPAGELAEQATELGVSWAELPCGRVYRAGPIQQLRSVAVLTQAATALLRLSRDCDLLHANSTAAALACLPAARLRRLPLLWHVRDLRLPNLAFAALAPRVTKAIAISHAVAERLRRGGVPAGRIELIPNALEPVTMIPQRPRDEVRAELGLPSDARLAIAVGQLVPWKGHDLLLEAFARLAADHPQLHLAVVGSDLFGDQPEYVAALGARAARPDLAGRVHLTGHRDDVPDLLAAADLFILPSFGEPFGRVVIEAMAAGLPVIATMPGGPAEIVVPGRTGLLVPQGRPEALAQAIRFVVSLTEAERGDMGRAGQLRVRRRYAPAAHSRAIERLYEQVL